MLLKSPSAFSNRVTHLERRKKERATRGAESKTSSSAQQSAVRRYVLTVRLVRLLRCSSFLSLISSRSAEHLANTPMSANPPRIVISGPSSEPISDIRIPRGAWCGTPRGEETAAPSAVNPLACPSSLQSITTPVISIDCSKKEFDEENFETFASGDIAASKYPAYAVVHMVLAAAFVGALVEGAAMTIAPARMTASDLRLAIPLIISSCSGIMVCSIAAILLLGCCPDQYRLHSEQEETKNSLEEAEQRSQNCRCGCTARKTTCFIYLCAYYLHLFLSPVLGVVLLAESHVYDWRSYWLMSIVIGQLPVSVLDLPLVMASHRFLCCKKSCCAPNCCNMCRVDLHV